MKNKRYKRKAKKILGNCINNYPNCNQCTYENRICKVHFNHAKFIHIKNLEGYCKNEDF